MYKLDRIGSKKIVKDLELKEIHLGRKVGNLTGNPFIDKNWVVRYPDRDINFSLWDTPYNNFERLALQNPDRVILYDLVKNKTYTNREVLELVDRMAKGLLGLNINDSSRVGVMLNSCVEEATTFLALSKIGCAGKYIDFMKSVPAMAHSVLETHLDALVMEEMFLPLEPAINGNHLPVIVANTVKHYENKTSVNELMNINQDTELKPSGYVHDKVTTVINSSGTTGEPKPIMHTDYSVNSAALKMLYTNLPLNESNALLKMMPIQLGIGLVTSLYTGLISGTPTILVGGVEAPDLAAKMIKGVTDFDNIRKKLNLKEDAKLTLITAPIFFRMLINCPEVTDLSHMGGILTAGSKMDKKELDAMKPLLEAKNCPVPVCNAYGQNEQFGAVSCNTVEYNQNGSAGYPVIGTDIRIVNPDTYEELGLNEEGLILEASDSCFLGYDGKEKETKKAFVTLSDGTQWFDTRDLGFMDDTYFLHVTGRLARVVNRNDFKFNLDDIEQGIKSIPGFLDCAVIAPGEVSSWEDIICYVKVDSRITDPLEAIKNAKILAEFAIPTECIMIDSIPYLLGGKPDYKKLTNMYRENNNEIKLSLNK